METKTKMTARVPVEKFVQAYLAALRDGKTYHELAVELGLKHGTVYQRAYELRRQGFDELKPLVHATRQANVVARARKAVEDFLTGGEPKKEKPKAAPKKEAEKKAEIKAALADGEDMDADEAETLDSIFG